jgi:hypothetical protein
VTNKTIWNPGLRIEGNRAVVKTTQNNNDYAVLSIADDPSDGADEA